MAKVVVLANRTTSPAIVVLLPSGQLSTSISIAPGESRPVFFDKALRVRYQESRMQREYKLDESSVYFFTYGTQPGAIRLEKIGLGADPNLVEAEKEKLAKTPFEMPAIHVKLLVDDDEPTHQRIWEARLRARFEDAAEIIERHSGVRMVVDSVSTWDSDDLVNDFSRSLREFEQEVSPQPALLAIGFSSQYRIARGRVHLGGTRGALHPYILLKERSPQVREAERLELLVHEIGHYLGAAHSPEPFSVMRPVISGGKQRRLGSHIQFDPVNTLLIAMVGDEIRSRGIRSLASLPESKKNRMAEIYGVLHKSLPDDPAAANYQQLIRRVSASPLVKETHQVLDHLVVVAKLRHQIVVNQQKALGTKASIPLFSKNHDAVTNSLVRQAAKAAQGLKSGNAPRAFLLALGIFMDDTDTLRRFPPTSRFITLVERDADRLVQLQKLDQPTMRGRADLARHFFISAFTTVAIGGKNSHKLGLAKEWADAHQGSGFSFADMAANQAGILFAERVLADQLTLAIVAQNFSCEAFLPPVDDLQENLAAEEFKKQFGSIDDPRLSAELNRIEALVLSLPIYQLANKKIP